jgi:hypothetical protein
VRVSVKNNQSPGAESRTPLDQPWQGTLIQLQQEGQLTPVHSMVSTPHPFSKL